MRIRPLPHRHSNEPVQFARAVSSDSHLELFSVALRSVASAYELEAQQVDLVAPADVLFDPRMFSFAKLLGSTADDRSEEQQARSLSAKLSALIEDDRQAALRVAEHSARVLQSLVERRQS